MMYAAPPLSRRAAMSAGDAMTTPSSKITGATGSLPQPASATSNGRIDLTPSSKIPRTPDSNIYISQQRIIGFPICRGQRPLSQTTTTHPRNTPKLPAQWPLRIIPWTLCIVRVPVPIRYPLPHVARHVVCSVRRHPLGSAAHRLGRPGNKAKIGLVAFQLVSPGIYASVGAARGLLPTRPQSAAAGQPTRNSPSAC